MTREEAIRLIGWLKCTTNREDDLEAIDMAIEALSADAVSLTGTMKYLTKPHNYCEVVRCKDCKYGETSEVNKYYIECTLNEVPTFVDGFCSYGKRKTPTIPTFAESEKAYKAWTGEEMGKTHGRLIDADKLKKQLDTVYNEMANERERKGLRLARWFLISAPTVSADRPHGEWYQIKDHKIMGEGYLWHCSICDYKVYQDSSKDYPTENYCPNCGALMLKGGDTE